VVIGDLLPLRAWHDLPQARSPLLDESGGSWNDLDVVACIQVVRESVKKRAVAAANNCAMEAIVPRSLQCAF
jgi:hypothetical protein